jgi:hypothetical protein
VLESAVFESVVKVVEKFTDLLKTRHERRREFFTAVIDPVFNDLSIVHADYLKMFDECETKLRRSKAKLNDIARELAMRRIAFEGLRVKSRAVVEAVVGTNLDDEYKDFLLAAARYIPTGELGVTQQPLSPPRDIERIPTEFSPHLEYGTQTPSGNIVELISAAGTSNEVNSVVLTRMARNDSRELEEERIRLAKAVLETTKEIRARWAQICTKYTRARAWSLK